MYAIVQHSAMGYNNDTTFKFGLESKRLTTASVKLCEKIGGIIFPDYGSAEDYCEREMYPAGTNGLIPNAPGAFSEMKVDGLRIYIPRERD